MIGETVTIVRAAPGGTDAYGDPIPSTTARIDVPGCAFAPRYSSESTDRGRQGVVVGGTVYLPSTAPAVLPSDRIEVRGRLYEVDGEVGEWISPFTGWAPGFEVAVRRAVG